MMAAMFSSSASLAGSPIKLLLLAVLAALALAVLVYVYWVKVEHRLTVVTPGRAYQSAAMPPEDMVRVAKSLGVQTVFDFRGETPESCVRSRPSTRR